MSAAEMWFEQGSDEYAAATAPHNSTAVQQPAFVARPADAESVAAVVSEAARRGLIVVPQATGHGAGGTIGDESVVLDTTRLDSARIDPEHSIAVVGAGLTWDRVNRAADEHGLLGLAGSAPSVAVCGYTFGGGIGFLSRPHGMASAKLRRVEYVDGAGRLREASDDAADELDREAMWAFRGGGGVGIATRLEFGLVNSAGLYGGYLLWNIAGLDAVVDAWAQAMAEAGDDVATSIAVLHAPPAPPFPDDLRGQPVVHLAVTGGRGGVGAAALLDRVRAAATPRVATWGPVGAAELGEIHLDPPAAVPAIGGARWLTADAPASAASMLALAAPVDSPLAMTEVRSVGNDAPATDGAMTTMPGPYIVHAVGAAPEASRRPAIDEALAAIYSAAEPADAGLSVGSWMEGEATVPDALPPAVRTRVAAAADRVDPSHTLARNRYLV